MKTLFILASVILVLFLAAPDRIEAQQISHSVAATANKSWKPFWTQFTAAVKSKNKVALKRLMVAEREFFDGDEGGTRNQWLEDLDKQKLWGEVYKSVKTGTKNYNVDDGKPRRVTRDNGLIFVLVFVYRNKRWQFYGVMGYGE